MSIARSMYRQILKSSTRLSKHVPDPHDFFTCLFGIAITQSDWMAAGYGESVHSILRHGFERPLVVGDPADTPLTRTTSAFALLKAINKANQRTDFDRINRTRSKMYTMAKAANSSGDVSVTQDKMFREVEDLVKELAEEEEEQEQEAGGEEREQEEEGEEKEDDDGVVMGECTIFVEASKGSKVRKLFRHSLVAYGREGLPYSYTLPPEPFYSTNTVFTGPFEFMTEAIIGMVATSRRLQQEAAAAAAAAEKQIRGKKVAPTAIDEKKLLVAAPQTKEDRLALLHEIPTRAVQRTDFMEVEVCTQYVCSNPNASDKHEDGEPQYLFIYYVFVRNKSILNPLQWHAHILSQHLVILDVEQHKRVEITRPGIGGDVLSLAPGESHALEVGASLLSQEGILRGTLQVNIYNESGEVRLIDVALPPTRLSTTAEASEYKDDDKTSQALRRLQKSRISTGEDWTE